MKILTTSLIALMLGTYVVSDFSPNLVSAAFAETDEATAKVMDIQRALKEFGFYKGKIDGKIKRSLYDAMSKYTAYVRSKGWSDATGELTEEEIAFLLRQYEKRMASLAAGSGGSSQSASVGGPSSGTASEGATATDVSVFGNSSEPGQAIGATVVTSPTVITASPVGGASTVDGIKSSDALKQSQEIMK